jgi:hypothetical protein
MTIKQQTIVLIEKVLSQNKLYYRCAEFGFQIHKRGCSTYQGAILRDYLKANGYVNVRLSMIKLQFFVDNREEIRKFMTGKPMSESFLKANNTIIMKQEVFEKYKEKYVFKPKYKEEHIFNPIGEYKPNTIKPAKIDIKPAIMGFGEVVLPPMPMSLEMDKKSQAIETLVVKYKEKLHNLSISLSEEWEKMTDNEICDLEQRIADLAEVVRDLKSI